MLQEKEIRFQQGDGGHKAGGREVLYFAARAARAGAFS